MKRTIVTLVVMLIAPLAFAQTSSTHKRQATTTEPITVTGTIIPTPVDGFIALFGTAVQTGVVMMIYLEDAVRRKVATTQIEGLHEAVMTGALLRLRPKLMTVATVVAGLLPIMWSTRIGAEFMKPLATPVLGGMVSCALASSFTINIRAL